ncbi:MAG: serine hydrolase [Chitinophagaceae bacterium]|nr:serine hydrolase [Chitinophagaceae bacterium]
MKNLFTLMLLCSLTMQIRAQSLYFPPLAGSTWDTLSATSLGWCTDKVDSLYNYLQDNNSKAFILLKDGKIVFEKYFGTFTADSVWYWASAGKSLTSFVVGIAQQESLLAINDASSSYLGTGWTVAPPAKELQIKIRNQLTMTTGLDDGVPNNACTIDTCLQYLADAGTRWAYHNGPYTLLDSVIVSATGTTLNNYLQQKVKAPTGMTGLYVTIDYDHVFHSKPRSMARYGLLMLNKGKWNNTPVMTDTNYFQQMIQSSQALNPSYGYLWWLNGKSAYMVPGLQVQIPGSLSPAAPADMYAALGKNGQMLHIVPSQNLVWLRMGDAPNAGIVPFLMNDTIWQKLNQIMCVPAGFAQQQEPDFQYFPNPVDEVLHISTGNLEADLSLCDLYGRTLIEALTQHGSCALNTAELSAGLYILNIRYGKSKVSRMIHIRH